MPTARELLDQADALMRRNRPAPAPDAPARDASVPDAPAAAEDGIPTLMDAVKPPPADAPRAAPSARALVRGEAANDLEDVPLLTDAVEEIEAPSILEEPLEPEAPETWDDTLTGARTITPPAPVELSPGPPARAGAVGVLPEEWDVAPPPHGGPTLAVETIEIPPPRESVESISGGPGEPQSPLASSEETSPNFVADTADETEPATPFEWPSHGPPLPGRVGLYEAPPSAPAEIEPSAPAEIEPSAPAEIEVSAPAEIALSAAAEAPLSPPPEASLPVAAAPAAAPAPRADDEARWSALAEEIRMQVLQRIDLFTDTGLREQLGARLQPIVDRASADLVATINQHVGVLLRAYVAEAIEREIERWRAERR